MWRSVKFCLFVGSSSSKIVKYDSGFDVPGRGHVPLEHEIMIKDLGVLVDSDLSYDDHVQGKINVANKMLGIIRRNFVDLDKNSFLLLYKSLVRINQSFNFE